MADCDSAMKLINETSTRLLFRRTSIFEFIFNGIEADWFLSLSIHLISWNDSTRNNSITARVLFWSFQVDIALELNQARIIEVLKFSEIKFICPLVGETAKSKLAKRYSRLHPPPPPNPESLIKGLLMALLPMFYKTLWLSRPYTFALVRFCRFKFCPSHL